MKMRKLRQTRYKSRNSAVQFIQLIWTKKYKICVQRDFKFTSAILSLLHLTMHDRGIKVQEIYNFDSSYIVDWSKLEIVLYTLFVLFCPPKLNAQFRPLYRAPLKFAELNVEGSGGLEQEQHSGWDPEQERNQELESETKDGVQKADHIEEVAEDQGQV